jgi:cytochrome c oxidase subunit 2
VYGSRVQLADGKTVLADDAYIRESILNPNAKIVAGYQAQRDAELPGPDQRRRNAAVIVYIKSLAITNAPGALL